MRLTPTMANEVQPVSTISRSTVAHERPLTFGPTLWRRLHCGMLLVVRSRRAELWHLYSCLEQVLSIRRVVSRHHRSTGRWSNRVEFTYD